MKTRSLIFLIALICTPALAGSILCDVLLYEINEPALADNIQRIYAEDRQTIEDRPQVPSDGRIDDTLLNIQRATDRRIARLFESRTPIVRDRFTAVPGTKVRRSRDSLNCTITTKGDNLLYGRHDGYLSISGGYRFEYQGSQTWGSSITFTSGPNTVSLGGTGVGSYMIVVHMNMRY